MLTQVGGHSVSTETVARVAKQVGTELVAQRDRDLQPDALPAEPPALAVVQCDGGRIRTREPNHGAGVHQPSWRETKNACLIRMSSLTFEEDPHPQLPRAFRDPERVASFAETTALSLKNTGESYDTGSSSDDDWRPRRLVRTCLSSMACSDAFGQQMLREARQRRFPEAERRAFLGDGLAYNWSIQQKYFDDFVPILDFIHALSYLYAAAVAIFHSPDDAWACYLRMAHECWQGKSAAIIDSLQAWLHQQGFSEDVMPAEDDPRHAVAVAARYLSNNLGRMDYPAYRRQGLPVTSALMESLVKEINHRVKGSEMFWNDPEGAEAILQIRAASLCDDDRLAGYLRKRPGYPYHRRTTLTASA
jgi:hypothetical protein